MFRHNYHLVLDQALADINTVARPCFAVMDATIGLEGNSPKSGIPKVVNRLLASGDPVALDAVAAKVMGFDPEQIGHLAECMAAGLGTADLRRITTVGEDDLSLALKLMAPLITVLLCVFMTGTVTNVVRNRISGTVSCLRTRPRGSGTVRIGSRVMLTHLKP